MGQESVLPDHSGLYGYLLESRWTNEYRLNLLIIKSFVTVKFKKKNVSYTYV